MEEIDLKSNLQHFGLRGGDWIRELLFASMPPLPSSSALQIEDQASERPWLLGVASVPLCMPELGSFHPAMRSWQ